MCSKVVGEASHFIHWLVSEGCSCSKWNENNQLQQFIDSIKCQFTLDRTWKVNVCSKEGVWSPDHTILYHTKPGAHTNRTMWWAKMYIVVLLMKKKKNQPSALNLQKHLSPLFLQREEKQSRNTDQDIVQRAFCTTNKLTVHTTMEKSIFFSLEL